MARREDAKNDSLHNKKVPRLVKKRKDAKDVKERVQEKEEDPF